MRAMCMQPLTHPLCPFLEGKALIMNLILGKFPNNLAPFMSILLPQEGSKELNPTENSLKTSN